MDPSTLAQKVLSNYNTWTWQQQTEMQKIVGQRDQLLTTLELMNCIRNCKDKQVLNSVEDALNRFNQSYKSGNDTKNEDGKKKVTKLDDLLDMYVSNEQKFTLVQKQIMAAIVVPNPPLPHQLNSTSDAIIVSSIVHGQENDLSLVRLEKTMQNCLSMYRPPVDTPPFSPVPSYPHHLYPGALNFTK